MEKIWKRLRPFRLSPQRPVSATRSSDRELRPRSPAVLAGVQTKHGVLFVEGGPSTQPYARGPLRPPRDISMPRARARATPNARARLVSFAPLPHPLTLAARCRRRLERTTASQQVGAAGWPEPQPARELATQAGPKPAAASELAPQACIEKSLCSSRVPSASTTCFLALETTRQAGKRSGYRTLRARSSNHSAAGPSPAGIAGGPGGRQHWADPGVHQVRAAAPRTIASFRILLRAARPVSLPALLTVRPLLRAGHSARLWFSSTHGGDRPPGEHPPSLNTLRPHCAPLPLTASGPGVAPQGLRGTVPCPGSVCAP